MDDGVLQAALALPEEDRRELAERIRESLVSQEEGDRDPPRCGCSHVVRRGRDADGAECAAGAAGLHRQDRRPGGLQLPLGTWLATSTPRSRGVAQGCAKRCSVSLRPRGT